MDLPKSVFSMPARRKITGLSSTITNVFAVAIIPVIRPTDDEVHGALQLLGMSVDSVSCAYCGDPHTEWDHLRPTIKDQRPTGYISEIRNFVPACGKCNQSKGNKNWREWMLSDAPLSPKTRSVEDLCRKIANLEKYESQSGVTCIHFGAVLSAEIWGQHWKNWDAVVGEMKKAEMLAAKIGEKLQRSLPWAEACPSGETLS